MQAAAIEAAAIEAAAAAEAAFHYGYHGKGDYRHASSLAALADLPF